MKAVLPVAGDWRQLFPAAHGFTGRAPRARPFFLHTAAMSRGTRSRQKRTARSEPVKRRLFLQRIAAVYGISEAAAEELFSVERRASIRINRLTERPPAEVAENVRRRGFQIEPIPWCPD